MNKKPSWDDITSLNLESEDKSGAENPLGHGDRVRMPAHDILNILKANARIIFVQVATSKGILPGKGILNDIKQNGMCCTMQAHGLRRNDPIRTGTMLGGPPFQTNAIVCRATE